MATRKHRFPIHSIITQAQETKAVVVIVTGFFTFQFMFYGNIELKVDL